ncbi:MAG: hypothetical protein MJD61_13525 [Proteobacteria bacterium]|nr:hypothetical protein [Pseudomonadota bacterium]
MHVRSIDLLVALAASALWACGGGDATTIPSTTPGSPGTAGAGQAGAPGASGSGISGAAGTSAGSSAPAGHAGVAGAGRPPTGPPTGGAAGASSGSGGTGQAGAAGAQAGASGAPSPGAAGTGGAAGGNDPPAMPVSVSWSFPGFIDDGNQGLTFPTYLAHLFGKQSVRHPLNLRTACAALSNPSSVPRDVRVSVRFPVYAAEATVDVQLDANETKVECVDPVFNISELYRLRAVAQGRAEVSVTDKATGAEYGSAMKTVAVSPVNDAAWKAMGVERKHMIELASVFVTKDEPDVDKVQRLAAELSVFGGFGGGSPYERQPYPRPHDIGPGEHVVEHLFVEESEEIAWELLAVSGGVNDDVDVYLFTPEQYAAWNAGTANAATLAWHSQRSGALERAKISVGWYALVIFNPSDNFLSRSVRWSRNVTREDVVRDVLRSIFGALRSLQIAYSNIPNSYFDGWQHIRRADETLSALSANCLDGSLLFASVIELLGMEPFLITKTGHAYVGVRAHPDSTYLWPLETTRVGSMQYTFADAYVHAQEALANDSKNDPLFQLIDIKAMRTRGILPLPQ